jgi:hypothetical protein
MIVKGYQPLSSYLRLRRSKIHGHGIHAAKDIKPGTQLGMSHLSSRTHGLIRTATGAYVNHSETPNAMVEPRSAAWYLVATENIKKGEEVTVNYKNHACGENYEFE